MLLLPDLMQLRLFLWQARTDTAFSVLIGMRACRDGSYREGGGEQGGRRGECGFHKMGSSIEDLGGTGGVVVASLQCLQMRHAFMM